MWIDHVGTGASPVRAERIAPQPRKGEVGIRTTHQRVFLSHRANSRSHSADLGMAGIVGR